MEARSHHSRMVDNPPPVRGRSERTAPLDLEKQILSIALQMKRIVSSKLLGEISDQQYQLQVPVLVERYKTLMRVTAKGGL